MGGVPPRALWVRRSQGSDARRDGASRRRGRCACDASRSVVRGRRRVRRAALRHALRTVVQRAHQAAPVDVRVSGRLVPSSRRPGARRRSRRLPRGHRQHHPDHGLRRRSVSLLHGALRERSRLPRGRGLPLQPRGPPLLSPGAGERRPRVRASRRRSRRRLIARPLSPARRSRVCASFAPRRRPHRRTTAGCTSPRRRGPAR